jgi:hypothetical protein
MTSFFRLLLDQLLLELGMSAPPSSVPAAGAASHVRAIAELDAWIKQRFARVRDLLARIRVAVKSAVSAEPSASNTPIPAPASSPAPASDIAPPQPYENMPSSPIQVSDDGQALDDERSEPDAIR